MVKGNASRNPRPRDPKVICSQSCQLSTRPNAGVTRGHVPVLSAGSQQDSQAPENDEEAHPGSAARERQARPPRGKGAGQGRGTAPGERAISSKAGPSRRTHIGVCREGARQTVSPMAPRPTRLPKYSSKEATKMREAPPVC